MGGQGVGEKPEVKCREVTYGEGVPFCPTSAWPRIKWFRPCSFLPYLTPPSVLFIDYLLLPTK